MFSPLLGILFLPPVFVWKTPILSSGLRFHCPFPKDIHDFQSNLFHSVVSCYIALESYIYCMFVFSLNWKSWKAGNYDIHQCTPVNVQLINYTQCWSYRLHWEFTKQWPLLLSGSQSIRGVSEGLGRAVWGSVESEPHPDPLVRSRLLEKMALSWMLTYQ